MIYIIVLLIKQFSETYGWRRSHPIRIEMFYHRIKVINQKNSVLIAEMLPSKGTAK